MTGAVTAGLARSGGDRVAEGTRVRHVTKRTSARTYFYCTNTLFYAPLSNISFGPPTAWCSFSPIGHPHRTANLRVLYRYRCRARDSCSFDQRGSPTPFRSGGCVNICTTLARFYDSNACTRVWPFFSAQAEYLFVEVVWVIQFTPTFPGFVSWKQVRRACLAFFGVDCRRSCQRSACGKGYKHALPSIPPAQHTYEKGGHTTIRAGYSTSLVS